MRRPRTGRVRLVERPSVADPSPGRCSRCPRPGEGGAPGVVGGAPRSGSLDAEFKDELERLQALVRSSVPDGDLGKVIRLAVSRELKRLEAKRFGKVKKPRKRLGKTDTRAKSRHIPAPVRRFVEKRDGGRCTYSDKHRRRCTKRHLLEFHHVRPFGRGGDHSPEGIVLMCRTHNQLLAEQEYGREKMTRHRLRAGAHPPPG